MLLSLYFHFTLVFILLIFSFLSISTLLSFTFYTFIFFLPSFIDAWMWLYLYLSVFGYLGIASYIGVFVISTADLRLLFVEMGVCNDLFPLSFCVAAFPFWCVFWSFLVYVFVFTPRVPLFPSVFIYKFCFLFYFTPRCYSSILDFIILSLHYFVSISVSLSLWPIFFIWQLLSKLLRSYTYI